MRRLTKSEYLRHKAKGRQVKRTKNGFWLMCVH